MNAKKDGCKSIPTESTEVTFKSSADSEQSPSRRRLLLSGVLKGSALAATAVPIRSFASTPSLTKDGRICTISGAQSAAHSQKSTLPPCKGWSPGYYKMVEHWPNYNSASNPLGKNNVGNVAFDINTQFNKVFGSGPTTALITIMLTVENSLEFHYIAALLNAIKPPSGYVFPYSASEVIAIYNSPQKASGKDFFYNYLEA